MAADKEQAHTNAAVTFLGLYMWQNEANSTLFSTWATSKDTGSASRQPNTTLCSFRDKLRAYTDDFEKTKINQCV